MGSSKLLAPSVLLALALLVPHAQMATAANSNLFVDYIGAIFNGVQFSDVPINPNVQFDFTLAFVIDYTTTTTPPSPTNGQFEIYWQSSVLTASAVAAIKQSNPNVRVNVSLGGATQYNLDGIDIDYEQFQADPATFAECIGQLVTTLKNNGVIKFASIAPFDNSDVQSHYQALWSSYSSVIDYINFQFYAYDSSTTADQYVSHFNDQIANYPGGNILASFTTDTSSNSVPIATALSACQTLQSQRNLYGIFIWAADYSGSEGFKYETQAQALVANANS
nr:unnamed protein product [Digitaria exilis]